MQAPSSSLALPQGSRSPTLHDDDADSPASTRSSRPMTSPRPVSPLAPPRLCTPLTQLWPVSPRTPLGSLIPPAQPQSVVALLPACTSRSTAVSPQLPCHPLFLRHCHRYGPANQLLHLGLPRHGCRLGTSVSLLHLGLHIFQLCLFRSVPRFHPDRPPRLHPGSSHRRLHHGVPLC